jgi:hypothetical protein
MNFKIFLESVNNLELNLIESYISHYYDSIQPALKEPPHFDKNHAQTALNDVYAHILETGGGTFFVNVNYNFETQSDVELSVTATFSASVDHRTPSEDQLELAEVRLRKLTVYDAKTVTLADSVAQQVVNKYFMTNAKQLQDAARDLITDDIRRLAKNHSPASERFYSSEY